MPAINDTRVDPLTGEPEIYKSTGWITDWDLLLAAANLTERTLTITTPSGPTVFTVYDEFGFSFRLQPTVGKQFIVTPTLTNGIESVSISNYGFVVGKTNAAAPSIAINEEDIPAAGRIGEVWASLSLANKPADVILDGAIFDNATYPALAALAATMDVITDNGDGTSTVTIGDYFPRPGTTNIGNKTEDSFESHRHIGGKSVYGSEAAFGTTTGGGGNNGVSNWDASNTTKPFTSSTGGSETAPKHWNCFMGLWAA